MAIQGNVTMQVTQHFAAFNHSSCMWTPSHALHCSNQGAHIFVHCYSIDKEQFCSEMGWKLLESMWRNSLSQSCKFYSKCVSVKFSLPCISWQRTAQIAMHYSSIAWASHTHRVAMQVQCVTLCAVCVLIAYLFCPPNQAWSLWCNAKLEVSEFHRYNIALQCNLMQCNATWCNTMQVTRCGACGGSAPNSQQPRYRRLHGVEMIICLRRFTPSGGAPSHCQNRMLSEHCSPQVTLCSLQTLESNTVSWLISL